MRVSDVVEEDIKVISLKREALRLKRATPLEFTPEEPIQSANGIMSTANGFLSRHLNTDSIRPHIRFI